MKRLSIKPVVLYQIIFLLTIASVAFQCQNCQDIKNNNAITYIKVVFFLDTAQTAPIKVQLTNVEAQIQGTAVQLNSETIDGTHVALLLPSNSEQATYNFVGTYTDANNTEQKLARKFTINFKRKISILAPDCGVSENITLTSFEGNMNTDEIQLVKTNLDTTAAEGNVKIFLEKK